MSSERNFSPQTPEDLPEQHQGLHSVPEKLSGQPHAFAMGNTLFKVLEKVVMWAEYEQKQAAFQETRGNVHERLATEYEERAEAAEEALHSTELELDRMSKQATTDHLTGLGNRH